MMAVPNHKSRKSSTAVAAFFIFSHEFGATGQTHKGKASLEFPFADAIVAS